MIAMPKTKGPIRPERFLIHLILIAGAIVLAYPLLWMLSSSLKPEDLIFSDLSLWPKEVTFQNYVDGWSGVGTSFSTFLKNSAIISAGIIVGNLFSCSLAAYAFGRLEFGLKRLWFALMLMTMMLPFHVTIIPQYVLFHWLGWINTFLPLIVPHYLAVNAFYIFLMVQFIRGIPRELDDAARVDGAGPFQLYWQIMLPLMRPALVTTAIFSFVGSWNEFFGPLLYLSDPSKFTVPLGLRLFLDSMMGSSWGPMFAMSILSLAPVFIVFLIFQRLLIEGISTTGLKG